VAGQVFRWALGGDAWLRVCQRFLLVVARHCVASWLLSHLQSAGGFVNGKLRAAAAQPSAHRWLSQFSKFWLVQFGTRRLVLRGPVATYHTASISVKEMSPPPLTCRCGSPPRRQTNIEVPMVRIELATILSTPQRVHELLIHRRCNTLPSCRFPSLFVSLAHASHDWKDCLASKTVLRWDAPPNPRHVHVSARVVQYESYSTTCDDPCASRSSERVY